MKTFSLTTGLSLLLVSSVSLVAQARPGQRWWFQSVNNEPVETDYSTQEAVSPKVTQPVLVTESDPVPDVTTPTPRMQPHQWPTDPRQLSHDYCPPCGMG